MHAQNLTLRPVRADEGPALADLRVQAMHDSLQALGRFNADRARARFLDGFEPALTRAVVVAGQTAGLVVLRPVQDQANGQSQGLGQPAGAEPHLLLDHLYIAPSHQGLGLGAEVLRRVFEEADAAGLAVRVGALKGSRSNAFYLSHGFQLEATSEWDLHYLRPAQLQAPIAAHACPLCGQPNGCAAARSGSFNTPCWCTDARFAPALLARVPEPQRGRACICRACAKGSTP